MNKKEELQTLLEKVKDTYPDFVHGVLLETKDSDELMQMLIDYIMLNPNANSSDIAEKLYNNIFGKE